MTPIYKGSNKSECASYRPVVLTSHISKVFERVGVDYLVRHLERGDLLSNSQHGLGRERSCASQLLQHQHTLLRWLESGNDDDVIYLDFSKAFDRVDYGILLTKLRGMKLRGFLFTWLQAFLLRRRQRVAVESHMSRWCLVRSGVPQGTVLGPILFLAHITDIEASVNAQIFCFADDTSITRAVRTEGDVALLQKDLDAVYD